jgi:serine/threonine protein kinase
MEPMALGSLHDVLQDELLLAVNDVPTVVHILMNVVAGIRYLHGAKAPFVHCAIRAKNILLDEQLTAKV